MRKLLVRTSEPGSSDRDCNIRKESGLMAFGKKAIFPLAEYQYIGWQPCQIRFVRHRTPRSVVTRKRDLPGSRNAPKHSSVTNNVYLHDLRSH